MLKRSQDSNFIPVQATFLSFQQSDLAKKLSWLTSTLFITYNTFNVLLGTVESVETLLQCNWMLNGTV